MLLWIVFAILTALAAIVIAAPLWRRGSFDGADQHDLEVYRQQLAEIEDERSRGLLGEAEAEAARIEISRRILGAADKDQSGGRSEPSAYMSYVAIGLLAAITMGTYLIYGSPQLPDQPLSARAVPERQPSVEELVAHVEERLTSHPDDGTGWSVIAPVYMRLGRYDEAAKAFQKALELLGPTPERLGNLGEALTLANGGVVTAEASAAFKKALEANADDTRSEFWLAVANEQKGELAEAVRQYRKLLERELPPNIKSLINQRLSDAEARLSGKTSPETEQLIMINKMVSGLAERLNADGSDLGGWLKLIRAYTVLGRREDALSAVKKAQGHFAGDENALGQIDEMARTLGLKS